MSDKKFRLIGTIIVFAILAIGYLVWQNSQSNNPTPTPSKQQDSDGLVIH